MALVSLKQLKHLVSDLRELRDDALVDVSVRDGVLTLHGVQSPAKQVKETAAAYATTSPAPTKKWYCWPSVFVKYSDGRRYRHPVTDKVAQDYIKSLGYAGITGSAITLAKKAQAK